MTRRWVEPAKSGNNGPLLSDNAVPKPLWLLNDTGRAGTFRCMKHIALILGVSLALITAPAVAAKRDNPLQLNYGELTVSTCNLADATEEARSILAARGWILLKILSLKG